MIRYMMYGDYWKSELCRGTANSSLLSTITRSELMLTSLWGDENPNPSLFALITDHHHENGTYLEVPMGRSIRLGMRPI